MNNYPIWFNHLYRRGVGLLMLIFGALLIANESVPVAYVMGKYGITNLNSVYGLIAVLCGLVIILDPRSLVVLLLSLPLVSYIGLQLWYNVVVIGGNGLAGSIFTVYAYGNVIIEIIIERMNRKGKTNGK